MWNVFFLCSIFTLITLQTGLQIIKRHNDIRRKQAVTLDNFFCTIVSNKCITNKITNINKLSFCFHSCNMAKIINLYNLLFARKYFTRDRRLGQCQCLRLIQHAYPCEYYCFKANTLYTNRFIVIKDIFQFCIFYSLIIFQLSKIIVCLFKLQN